MKDIFEGLNIEQEKAVREIEKPLLIIAGAGSGKTLTVASKIAYLIEQGAKTENILALTFNQKAAEELKNRVIGMLGNSEDLSISTFHSFCNQVIQDNILNTKLNANFKVITDTAQLVYLTKNINRFGIEHLEFNHEPYTLAEETAKFVTEKKVMRGLKIEDTATLKGYQLYHNFIRPHEALKGKTPAEACGIVIEGNDKWKTIIENASKKQQN